MRKINHPDYEIEHPYPSLHIHFADDAIFVYSIGINEVKYTCARIWKSKRGGGLLLEIYMQGFSSYFVCE